MSVIKIYLETEEFAAVERLAQALQASPEELAYTALNRLMLQADASGLQVEIAEARNSRRTGLALWSDSARSVHIYEGKPDDEQHPSRHR